MPEHNRTWNECIICTADGKKKIREQDSDLASHLPFSYVIYRNCDLLHANRTHIFSHMYSQSTYYILHPIRNVWEKI